MRDILDDEGVLNVYGYVLKTFKGKNGEERPDYNKLYENFYDKKVKNHFDFDRDELHNHYCDKDCYPF